MRNDHAKLLYDVVEVKDTTYRRRMPIYHSLVLFGRARERESVRHRMVTRLFRHASSCVLGVVHRICIWARERNDSRYCTVLCCMVSSLGVGLNIAGTELIWRWERGWGVMIINQSLNLNILQVFVMTTITMTMILILIMLSGK